MSVFLKLFIVAGSFGLAEFTDIKIKRRDEKVQKVSDKLLYYFVQHKLDIKMVAKDICFLNPISHKCIHLL